MVGIRIFPIPAIGCNLCRQIFSIITEASCYHTRVKKSILIILERLKAAYLFHMI